MAELLPFFIVLFAGVFFSELFLRFKVPWVVSLIAGGIIIGPFGLDIFQPDNTLDFMGEIGLVFLMFMAGLETRMVKKNVTRAFGRIVRLAILNSFIPFSLGFFIGLIFDLDVFTSLFIGTIFISSSIAVIIPSLESNKLLKCGLGRTIISSTIISDITSLVVLSILLQTIDPITFLPLPMFYFVLFILVVVLKSAIPKIRWILKKEVNTSRDIFQQELRSIFVILIGVVISFQFLGLHPIIAGFFAGMVMSETVKSNVLKEKLRAISYGIFIPIFFIVIGSKTDLSLIQQGGEVFWLTLVLVVVGIISKLISGYVGGRFTGYSPRTSMIIGAATIPQLSTTLAVAFAGLELNVIDEEIVAAFVILSLLTTVIGPVLLRILSKNYVRDEVEVEVHSKNTVYE
jgi:Kef-type K+ transport system membrane component KefB